MSKAEEMRSMRKQLRHIAMLARGMVITGEATKEEIFCFIMETGNEEFERAFEMDEEEVIFAMILEIANSEKFNEFMEEKERESR